MSLSAIAKCPHKKGGLFKSGHITGDLFYNNCCLAIKLKIKNLTLPRDIVWQPQHHPLLPASVASETLWKVWHKFHITHCLNPPWCIWSSATFLWMLLTSTDSFCVGRQFCPKRYPFWFFSPCVDMIDDYLLWTTEKNQQHLISFRWYHY